MLISRLKGIIEYYDVLLEENYVKTFPRQSYKAALAEFRLYFFQTQPPIVGIRQERRGK